MTSIHKSKRVDFALRHCHPDFNWRSYIFTDEKKFNLDGPDGYKYYWHVAGDPPLVYSKDTSAKKYVMVWGGISKNGQTPLMEVHGRFNSKRYCNMLKRGLLPYYEPDDVFHFDRASSHVSKETMEFLRKKKIKTSTNPAKSPDLNPIENAWGWMSRRVYADKPAYKNVDDLKAAIYEAWEAMPQEYIDALIDSMPRRMHQVIELKGEALDY